MNAIFKSLLLLTAAHTACSIASSATSSQYEVTTTSLSEKEAIYRSASTMLIVMRAGIPHVYLGRRNYNYQHVDGKKESFRYTDFGGKVEDKDIESGEVYPGLYAALREFSEETKKQYTAAPENLFPIAEIDVTNNLINEQGQINTKHSLFAFITDHFIDLNEIEGETQEESELDRYDLIRLEDLLSLSEPLEISRFTGNEGELLPGFYSLLKHPEVRRRLRLSVKMYANKPSRNSSVVLKPTRHFSVFEFPPNTLPGIASIKMAFQTQEPSGWVDTLIYSTIQHSFLPAYVRLKGEKSHVDSSIIYDVELVKDAKQKGKKVPGKAFRQRGSALNDLASVLNLKNQVNDQIRKEVRPETNPVEPLNLAHTASEAMLKHILGEEYIDGDRAENIKKSVTLIADTLGGKKLPKVSADAYEILERVMRLEDDHRDHYAIYHGTNSVSAFLYMLYKTLYTHIAGDNRRVFMPRLFDSDYFDVQTMNSLFDRDISTNEKLLSANFSIFSNWMSPGCNSLAYLMTNNSIEKQDIRIRISEILSNFNIPIDDALIERFNAIFERHFQSKDQTERAIMIQIFLPRSVVHDAIRLTGHSYGQNLVSKDYHALSGIDSSIDRERSEFTLTVLDLIRQGKLNQVAEKITSIAEDAQIRLVTQGNVFDQTAGASAHHHFYPAMEDGQFDVFAQELMQLVANILNPFVQTQLHNQYDMYHRSAKLVKYVLHDKANARLVPARKEDANLYGFLKSARFDDMTEYFRFYPDQLSLEPTAINANELIKDPHGSQKFKFNTFLDLIIHMGYEQNNYNRGENNKFGKFIVSHYKKCLISDPAQIESIKGILLASDDKYIYDVLFHDISQWTGSIKTKVAGSSSYEQTYGNIFHMRLDPHVAEPYLRKIAAHPGFKMHIETYTELSGSCYQGQSDWQLKQAQILLSSGFDSYAVLKILKISDDRPIYCNDIKELRNFIQCGLLRPDQHSSQIMKAFANAISSECSKGNIAEFMRSAETYMKQLYSLFPEPEREASIVSFISALAGGTENGRLEKQKLSSILQNDYVSMYLDGLEMIKRLHGGLPKVAHIVLGDLLSLHLDAPQRGKMAQLLDGQGIMFAMQDVLDLAGKAPANSWNNRIFNKISVRNIKQHCTSDVAEYGKILKILSDYNCSGPDVDGYADEVMDLIKSKLSHEDRDVCLSKVAQIEAELFGDVSGDAASAVNPPPPPSKAKRDFLYFKLGLDASETNVNKYVQSYISGDNPENLFKLFDHLKELGVWPEESLKRMFAGAIADGDAIELSQLKAYAMALGKSVAQWDFKKFSQERLDCLKTLVDSAGGCTLDVFARVLDTFVRHSTTPKDKLDEKKVLETLARVFEFDVSLLPIIKQFYSFTPKPGKGSHRKAKTTEEIQLVETLFANTSFSDEWSNPIDVDVLTEETAPLALSALVKALSCKENGGIKYKILADIRIIKDKYHLEIPIEHILLFVNSFLGASFEETETFFGGAWYSNIILKYLGKLPYDHPAYNLKLNKMEEIEFLMRLCSHEALAHFEWINMIDIDSVEPDVSQSVLCNLIENHKYHQVSGDFIEAYLHKIKFFKDKPGLQLTAEQDEVIRMMRGVYLNTLEEEIASLNEMIKEIGDEWALSYYQDQIVQKMEKLVVLQQELGITSLDTDTNTDAVYAQAAT